jgi:hypothetical protein
VLLDSRKPYEPKEKRKENKTSPEKNIREKRKEKSPL